MATSDAHTLLTIWWILSPVVYRVKSEAVAGVVVFLWYLSCEVKQLWQTHLVFISKVPCSGDIAIAHASGGEGSSKPGCALILMRLDGWVGYVSHPSVFFLCPWVGRRLDFPWALTQEKENHWTTWSSPLHVFFYLVLDVGPKLGASFCGEEEGGSSSVRLDPVIFSSLIMLPHKHLNFYLKYFF